MNEFERALAKTQKREERKTLTLPKVPDIQIAPIIKEKKPSIDAIIDVHVSLPYGDFDLSFTKSNVMGMKRLTKADFQKAISEGLRQILGTVK